MKKIAIFSDINSNIVENRSNLFMAKSNIIILDVKFTINNNNYVIFIYYEEN